jgi:hypothetical protein
LGFFDEIVFHGDGVVWLNVRKHGIEFVRVDLYEFPFLDPGVWLR